LTRRSTATNFYTTYQITTRFDTYEHAIKKASQKALP